MSCEYEAGRLGLGGSVRNLPDGSVEVVAEGDEAAVNSLVAWCRVGPGLARVQSVEVVTEEPVGEVAFRIIG